MMKAIQVRSHPSVVTLYQIFLPVFPFYFAAVLSLQDFTLGRATRSLESLNLSGNRLASVPVLVTNHTFPELRHIDLSENVIGRLSSISSALMPKLEFLDVRGNRIQSLPFYSLPLTLRYLDLTGKATNTIHNSI